MSENEDSGYESPASDHDEEELIILEKTLKRRWGDNSFEKSQSSSAGRSSEQVPEHEIAFRQILMLREKIKSTSPGKWRRLVPGYNLVLQRILKLAEETQSSSAAGEGALKCYVCLNFFSDKGTLKRHFSNVHLRTIYICTVEGCSEIFNCEILRNGHSYSHKM